MSVNAIPFPGSLKWVNSEPLTLEQLRGHVVLLDFWTYCCINCIHVLPDLRFLEEKYGDDPFVVIGIHSPKFENEKIGDNVKAAVDRYKIRHPVAMDNDHLLWQGYGIHAWPSFILIDAEGKVFGTASGEGNRDVLDQSIAKLLKEAREKKTLAAKRIQIPLAAEPANLLQFPGKILIDAESGRLFISNSNRNRIWITKFTDDDKAELLQVIGSGKSGFEDGDFSTARFKQPQGMALVKNRLYIADTENHAIRVADLDSKKVSTLSGNGDQGYLRQVADKPQNVSLNSPWDLEIVWPYLYIAMAGSHQIWRIDLEQNRIENFAGSGRENITDGGLQTAALAQPSGLASGQDKLYFADSEVSAVREVDLEKNKVHTLIGHGLFEFGHKDGSFKNALLQHALGVDYHDRALYVADTYNHAVRKMDLKKNRIETLVERHEGNFCRIDDVNCDVLPLFEPNDVVYYMNKLYIADTNNHLIRVFDLDTRILKEVEITGTSQSAA
ncbi:redoxin family protein [bacterium]|nr:redoxin family protein [bacterium]